MENEITSIMELENLLSISKRETVQAFMDTSPELLCSKEYIATEHFNIIKDELKKHSERVVYSEDLDTKTVPVNEFSYAKSGVYFLLDEDWAVVYVGQSRNIANRIQSHLKDKEFYYISYVEAFSEFDLYMIEDANIKYYNPTFNQNTPFSGYSLLKKFIRINEFKGISVANPVFTKRRRTYSQIRKAKVKGQQGRKQGLHSKRRTQLSEAYWNSVNNSHGE